MFQQLKRVIYDSICRQILNIEYRKNILNLGNFNLPFIRSALNNKSLSNFRQWEFATP